MSMAAIRYSHGMSRWAPDARVRLEQAALELYDQHGYDQTTTTQIAKRAGLTQRTFFRHFADKREVLFDGAGRLQDFLVDGVLHAPTHAAPLEAVAVALGTAGAVFPFERELSRQRQRIILANSELQERELIKLTSLSTALADALRQRGVPDRAARLAAEAGIAIFRSAYERWLDELDQDDFGQLIRDSLEELRTITNREDGGNPASPVA